MKIKLNIGCGNDYKPGYINIDTNKNVKADVYIKDENEINYRNVEEIMANKILPYFKDGVDTIAKWHKMLKKGGKIKLLVPHFTSPPYSMKAKRHYGYRVKDFYRFQKRENWMDIPKDIKFKVKIKIRLYKGLRFWNYIPELLININRLTQNLYEESFLCALFPAGVMEVEMEKV